jgi:hypothetical protein
MCRLEAFVRFYTEREGIKYDDLLSLWQLTELKHRLLVYTQGHLPEEAMMGDYPNIQRDSLVLSTESPKDVATIRVLSLLTLIYLPATFAAVSLLDPCGSRNRL